jgi:hypothetical protein
MNETRYCGDEAKEASVEANEASLAALAPVQLHSLTRFPSPCRVRPCLDTACAAARSSRGAPRLSAPALRS